MPTAVQCVSPTGDNSNDGRSWNYPKKDIVGAYDALPSTGGTIFVESGCYIDSVNTTRGLWIGGANDTQTGSLPTGWRAETSGGVSIVGVGNETPTNALGLSVAGINGGDPSDPTKPAVWVSGTDRPFHLENLHFRYPAKGIVIGVDSAGARANDATAGVGLYNVHVQLNNIAGNGPALDVGYCFWVWIERCFFAANAVETLGTDTRASVLINTTSVPSVNNFHMKDCNISRGGIRVKNAGTGGWNYDIENIVYEGNFVATEDTLFKIVTATNTGKARLKGFEIADATGTLTLVDVPSTLDPGQVTVEDMSVGVLTGPMTVLNRYPPGLNLVSSAKTPAGLRQVGFWRGRVSAQHDSARRSFGPVAARFANLANQDVTAWSGLSGSATVTTGKTAPDGSTNAARLTSASSNNYKQVYSAAATFGVGDWIVGGCWVRCETPPADLAPMEISSQASDNVFTYSTVNYQAPDFPNYGDGAWYWLPFADKFATIGTASSFLNMRLYVGVGNPCDFYAPTLMHVTAANAVSDSEMQEMAQHLGPYSKNVTVGDIGLLKGQALSFDGVRLLTNAGTPESAVTAPPGSYCADTTNGEGYIKKTGTGNTGWKLVTHA